jgi:hypothetical protein
MKNSGWLATTVEPCGGFGHPTAFGGGSAPKGQFFFSNPPPTAIEVASVTPNHRFGRGGHSHPMALRGGLATPKGHAVASAILDWPV